MRYALAIIVAGRRKYEVLAVSLVGTHLHNVRVEHHGEDLIAECVDRLPLSERKLACCYFVERFAEKVLRECGLKLLIAVVVVYATAEPNALQVVVERQEVLRLAVAFIIRENRLQHTADAEVVAPVLVEEDVAPLQGGLR